MGEVFKEVCCLHFYILHVVCNFHLILFTAKNATIKHMAMQQTGRIMDMSKYITQCVRI